ncbi:hypothetical protein NDU88_003650 [Pleurodeles waltl]|uniref:Uncharacterized protein n=1 Tax=Pleurodeles waltl TaxID=8319 RepID=A0AAV7T5V5_PLEWA|nr:hypothetical protein NDU88_003650 [Pleurodeles waltl]
MERVRATVDGKRRGRWDTSRDAFQLRVSFAKSSCSTDTSRNASPTACLLREKLVYTRVTNASPTEAQIYREMLPTVILVL